MEQNNNVFFGQLIRTMEDSLLSMAAGISTYSVSSTTQLLTELQRKIEEICTSFTGASSHIAALNAIESALDGFADTLKRNLVPSIYFSEVLASSALAAAERAIPHLPMEQRKECSKALEPISERSIKKCLSPSDVIGLIGVLVTIYFGLVTMIPDKQLERLVTQNDVIIEQQAELIELHQENAELRDTLDALADSIYLLADEVELLREELESPEDSPALEGQDDAENSQQHNCDAQN